MRAAETKNGLPARHTLSTPATERHGTQRWRMGRWIVRAWHQMGWRHVLLAILLQIGRDVFGPLGGVFLLQTQLLGYDPIARYLNGNWMIGGLSIVYCVLVADAAFDDGVPPLRAYGLAVIFFSTSVPIADWLFSGRFGWYSLDPLSIVWWSQVLLFQGGLGVSIYAYWRVTQRTSQRTQAVETERALNQQRIQSAKLLALQARVEPQILFDTLGHVGNLHREQPVAADALLADLIALLRTMQPRETSVSSTVEREFALVQAWLRVAGAGAGKASQIELRLLPEARRAVIVPMLVLPMARAALGLTHAAIAKWVLSACVIDQRLLVTLEAQSIDLVADPLMGADLTLLRDRLERLLSGSARLTTTAKPPSLSLELPLTQEDSDDVVA